MTRPLVLLVDDNEVNRYLAQFIMQHAGIDVALAGDDLQALQCAAQRVPDLVLMDLRMPVLDGYEATRRFKADPRLASVPVLALSAQAMPAELAQARAAGCAGHIAKPIDPATFAEQVWAWLRPQADAG